jgi:predicted membrane protein
MKTITEQELEDLRRIRLEINLSKEKLADVEIEIKRLNSFKEDLFSKIKTTYKDFSDQQNKLVEVYGSVNINLQTGEIIDSENI